MDGGIKADCVGGKDEGEAQDDVSDVGSQVEGGATVMGTTGLESSLWRKWQISP